MFDFYTRIHYMPYTIYIHTCYYAYILIHLFYAYIDSPLHIALTATFSNAKISTSLPCVLLHSYY